MPGLVVQVQVSRLWIGFGARAVGVLSTYLAELRAGHAALRKRGNSAKAGPRLC